MKDARTFLGYHYNHVTFHGIRYGRGMKLIMVPKFSKGTLVTWSEGLTGIAVVEHNSDAHIHVKELYNKDIDKLCHLYMYGYVEIHGEEAKWAPFRSLDVPDLQRWTRWKTTLCQLLHP